MGFIEVKDAGIDEKNGDLVSNILAWMEKEYSKGLFIKGVPYINGVQLDGAVFLNKMRKESEKGMRFAVVKNVECTLIPTKVSTPDDFDFVRKYGGGHIRYWYEHFLENDFVEDRISMKIFKVDALQMDEESGTAERVVLLVPAGCDYNERRNEILDAEKMWVEGMAISTSVGKKSAQERYVIVHAWKCVKDDLSVAGKALAQVKKWSELSPMVASNGANLFSNAVNACLLANAFYSKETVPAFNLLIIGPKRNQKSAAIKFLVSEVMKGSVTSGSSSTGKGWLISHKENAAPSEFFSEKKCLMVDEVLKSFSSGGLDHRGLLLRIKDFFVLHMEILQREKMRSTSGNGKIDGKMICSLFAVDNPDEYVLQAMGKGYKVADAAFRRWNFLYMNNVAGKVPYLSTEQAFNMMRKRLVLYGGVDAVHALMMLSRKKCRDYDGNADEAWIAEVRTRLKSELDVCQLVPESYDVICAIKDEDLKALVLEEAKSQLDYDMEDTFQAAWVSAAAMRGWEVHDLYEKYDLVFDEQQRALAEMIVRELFVGRIKLLFPGIITWFQDREGVQRKSIFGGV